MFVIAGVTGHVGSAAARALLAEGQEITVIVRDAKKGAAWSEQGAAVAVGVLQDEAFLTQTLHGAAGFFALLPPDYVASDLFAAQQHTANTIAAAVKASGVPHVVLLSSVGADLPDGTGPIKGLHYLETAVRATGAQVTAIRAGSFQENVANALGAARGHGIYPNFGTPHDYPIPQIATRDIGALVAKSLLAPAAASENVDLVGPAYTLREVVQKLGAAIGKPLQIVDVPQEHWVSTLTQNGVPPALAGALAEMYAAGATGKLAPRGDRIVLGQVPLDDVIAQLVA